MKDKYQRFKLISDLAQKINYLNSLKNAAEKSLTTYLWS